MTRRVSIWLWSERVGYGCKAGPEGDVGEFFEARQHFSAQEPVGQVVAEGLVGQLGGVEVLDIAGLLLFAASVHDAHDLKCCGMGFQTLP
jgi:hypothetical protein